MPTVFDFGHNGKPPTHPDLLDWLACEFLEHNWDMKHLHRLMVTSQAYQLSSVVPEHHPGLKLDPDNKLLWHMNADGSKPRRCATQCFISRTVLISPWVDRISIATSLNRRLGEVCVLSACTREAGGVLETYDVANVAECYRRSETIVPQQALALSNSELSREQSRKIADQILAAS